MKMSDVKESFFKKNVGCFTEDDVKSGDYSQQDVLDLLDGYESLLSAFSRYSNNHDRMADEIAELREACIGIYDDFAYEETISMSPSIFEVWNLGMKFKNK